MNIKFTYCRKVSSILVMMCFTLTGLHIPLSQAQEFILPAPGARVALSPTFNLPVLKGIKVYPDDPFRFDFILHQGDKVSSGDYLKQESTKLIKYFLTALTVPEKDLWVNLSPYEKDRIVPESFGQTEMGRDLLAEDYILKQITASLIYPEDEIGKKFWRRIYEEAARKFGTTNIPVNTFNKVWIVPEKAVVYENAKAGTAYVVESKLKVMLEKDYLALSKNVPSTSKAVADTNSLGSKIVREIVIPQLVKEVNEGNNFAKLRQAYQSLVLAAWYKKKIKDSILTQVYMDKNKISGVNISDPQQKQKIYEQYLKAFKKGVYNYIKEEVDPVTQATIPRKYFSGGIVALPLFGDGINSAMLVSENPSLIETKQSLDLFVVPAQLGILNDSSSGAEKTDILADKADRELYLLPSLRLEVLAVADFPFGDGNEQKKAKMIEVYAPDVFKGMVEAEPNLKKEEGGTYRFLLVFSESGLVEQVYFIMKNNFAVNISQSPRFAHIKEKITDLIFTDSEAVRSQQVTDAQENTRLKDQYGGDALLVLGPQQKLFQEFYTENNVFKNLVDALGPALASPSEDAFYLSPPVTQKGYGKYDEEGRLTVENDFEEEIITHLTQMFVMGQNKKGFRHGRSANNTSAHTRGVAYTPGKNGIVALNPKLLKEEENSALGTAVHELTHLFCRLILYRTPGGRNFFASLTSSELHNYF